MEDWIAGVRRSGCQGGSLPACEQTAHEVDRREADRECSRLGIVTAQMQRQQVNYSGFETGVCTRMNNDISS